MFGRLSLDFDRVALDVDWALTVCCGITVVVGACVCSVGCCLIVVLLKTDFN